MKNLAKYAAGLVIGLVLAVSVTVGAQSVTKRYRGNHVFDRIRADTYELTNVDAGASGTAGTVDVFPATAAKGKVSLTAADSAGDTTTTLVNASQAGARTYTIPDAGASASFVMSEGASTLAAVRTFTSIPVFPTGGITAGTTTITETEMGYADGLTAGTAAASKFALLDASKGIGDLGVVRMATRRAVAGTTFTTADPNPSRATLRANDFFLVDTSANVVDLDFSDDADLEAADLGTEWTFIVSAGGTNALTVTNGASGVVVTTLNTLGTTCEDVSDMIKCTARALEAVSCYSICAD